MSLTARPDNAIADFMHGSREQYVQIMADADSRQPIHFVLGNESGDLDSIASSIAYAYLLQQSRGTSQGELYIPLLNMLREDIDLRKESLYLFRLLGISLEDVLFLDDGVPLDELFKQDRLRLNLVDHNVLRPRQTQLSDAVESVIDHHFDEQKAYPLLPPQDKLIATVGSNATLVTEKALAASPSDTMPADLATLLLAPLLVDTANLTSPEKTTARDVAAAAVLQPVAADLLPSDYYEALLSAKNDIDGLTPAMLLSKDFKEYQDGELLYGISSLPTSVSWEVADLPTIQPDLADFAAKRTLALLIVLMPSRDAAAKRKILVFSPSVELLKNIDAYIRGDETLQSLLLPEFFSEAEQLLLYDSPQPLARKELQPLLDFSGLAFPSR